MNQHNPFDPHVDPHVDPSGRTRRTIPVPSGMTPPPEASPRPSSASAPKNDSTLDALAKRRAPIGVHAGEGSEGPVIEAEPHELVVREYLPRTWFLCREVKDAEATADTPESVRNYEPVHGPFDSSHDAHTYLTQLRRKEVGLADAPPPPPSAGIAQRGRYHDRNYERLRDDRQ